MDARFINPIIDAFRTILPQLGLSDIQRGNIRMGTNSVESLGVTVIIGMTNRSLPGLNNTLCLSPALIATKDDIDHITGAIDAALTRVFG